MVLFPVNHQGLIGVELNPRTSPQRHKDTKMKNSASISTASRSIEPLWFLQPGAQCQTGANGLGWEARRRRASWELSRDAAGEYGEAGDGGCGSEYAGWNARHQDAQSDQANAMAKWWVEESLW